jgi:hypothetical protein
MPSTGQVPFTFKRDLCRPVPQITGTGQSWKTAHIAGYARFACALFGKAGTSRLPGSVPCDAPITRNTV